MDDRTEHEIYAAPFLRSVMAGVASVMCSYSPCPSSLALSFLFDAYLEDLINETFACENDRTMNQILKGEFGFQGCTCFERVFFLALTDGLHACSYHVRLVRDALHARRRRWPRRTPPALPSSVAPKLTDARQMTMPGDITFSSGTSFFGPNLTAFVANASIAPARLDDMAARIVAGWYFLHQDAGYTPVNFNAFNPVDPATNGRVDVQADHDTCVSSHALPH